MREKDLSSEIEELIRGKIPVSAGDSSNKEFDDLRAELSSLPDCGIEIEKYRQKQADPENETEKDLQEKADLQKMEGDGIVILRKDKGEDEEVDADITRILNLRKKH